jgi:carbamoyl-phosphate synthase small subunit
MSNPSTARPVARLALEDGTVFSGRAFGACDAPVTRTGETVFNTAMCGYQEALTDPSYAGQILTMTAPMIGNYGVARDDVESARPHVAGFVIRELSRIPSNHRSEADLSSWLAKFGVLGIEGIDTRALVRLLRTRGALRGAISCDPSKTDAELAAVARSSPAMLGQNLACVVAPDASFMWKGGLGQWRTGEVHHAMNAVGRPLRVAALDCGAKRNIYRNLTERGCDVHVLPYDTPVEAIRAMRPDGLFVSNGPGDPEAVDAVVNTLRTLAGEIPTFGICLGHQLLALALGAKTFKLKFGHRGANQPVRNVLTGRVEITSQNHGFCVDPESLAGADCEVTHVHLNDQTLAGFRHRTKPVFSVQYHPEASPGPHDSDYLFDCFVEMMKTGLPLSAEAMAAFQRA